MQPAPRPRSRSQRLSAPPGLAASMAGFWERVEARLQDLVRDRARMARYMAVAWWVSTAFVVLGVGVMFAVKLGWWPY